MRTTHTYVLLQLSQAAYDEIACKLRAAGYDHAFLDDGDNDPFPQIVMQGIAVIPGEKQES